MTILRLFIWPASLALCSQSALKSSLQTARTSNGNKLKVTNMRGAQNDRAAISSARLAHDGDDDDDESSATVARRQHIVAPIVRARTHARRKSALRKSINLRSLLASQFSLRSIVGRRRRRCETLILQHPLSRDRVQISKRARRHAPDGKCVGQLQCRRGKELKLWLT